MWGVTVSHDRLVERVSDRGTGAEWEKALSP